MLELADRYGLGPYAARRGGSTPPRGTKRDRWSRPSPRHRPRPAPQTDLMGRIRDGRKKKLEKKRENF